MATHNVRDKGRERTYSFPGIPNSHLARAEMTS